MSLELNSLTEILHEIKEEIILQISLTKNLDSKIDTRKLLQQSKILNEIILASKINEEDKSMKKINQ